MKRAIIVILCILFVLGYFMPRNAYKVLHTKVNVLRVETIEITMKSPGIDDVVIVLDKKYEREMFWNMLREITAVRFPVKLKAKATDEPQYLVHLKRDNKTLHTVEIGKLSYVIDDKSYILIDFEKLQMSGLWE